MKFNYTPALLAAFAALSTFPATADLRHEIPFPDVLGLKTLKCDFHTHTVFSDGYVWPTVRIDEAWREGFDAIAITDHIEYKPHKEDVTTDDNRPYEVAAPQAKKAGVLLFRGSEITRSTPPGHYNAVFLSDNHPLVQDEFVDVVIEANKQGAFVFWNHPLWKGPELGDWREIQQRLYNNGWLHGIEVANGPSYYPEAHQWCLDKNLTMLGNSDIHKPSLTRRSHAGEHRTATLVFARENTQASIREAVFAGRTAVWAGERLIGRERFVRALYDATVTAAAPHHRTSNTVYFQIHNASPLNIQLKRTGKVGPSELTLEAGVTTMVAIRTENPKEALDLEYEAENLLIAPGKGLGVVITLPGAK